MNENLNQEQFKLIESIQEANTILEKGYPNNNDLLTFPLGKNIIEFQNINNEESIRYTGHLPQVVDKMNVLLSRTPVNIIANDRGSNPETDRAKFVLAFQKIWEEDPESRRPPLVGENPEDWKPLLRLSALYHDVGKLIVNDRHPFEGWYALKNVYDKESEKLENIIGKRKFPLFMNLLRHHDLFGVLSTGEASMPALGEVIGFKHSRPEEPMQAFSFLMILNLADSAGSFKLDTRTIGSIITDWNYLIETIRKTDGNRQDFIKKVTEDAQDPKNTIERIRRILVEAAPPNSKWDEKFTTDLIEEELKYALGVDLKEFCSEFAMICKIDYGLRFLRKLEAHCIKKGIETDAVVSIVIELLKRFVQGYRALTRGRDGSWRRIGIQTAGLTRNEEISTKLVESIVKENTRNRGMDWAAGEITVWYFN